MDPVITPSDSRPTPLSAATITVSLGWLLALEATIRWHVVGLYSAFGFGLLIIIWALLTWRRHSTTNVAAIAVILVVVTTLSGLSFASGIWAQHLIALAAAGMLYVVLQQRRRHHDTVRGRTMAFTTAGIVWFSWFALLSASILLNVAVQWLVLGSALVTSAATLLVWLESGVAWQAVWPGIIAIAWLAAELFIVIWWLPTSIIVGSTIATTILALVAQATRHLWRGQWEVGRARRYVLVGTVVCAIVLISARWV